MVIDPFAEIDTFLERWRASLVPPFTPAYVDGFIRRHRAQVESLIAETLAQRRARGGERPTYKPDFLAYDTLTTSQRRLDAQPDKQVLAELLRHVDGQFAEGYSERSVIHNFAVEYVDARTEAIFLRDAGWDVVPLLLERPALVVVAAAHVVAVRDWRGGLTIHPDRKGTLNHLFSDLDRAEEKLLQLREALDLYPNTKEQLVRYAHATWEQARKAALNLKPPATPNTASARKRKAP
jgi:hypothetical protein